MGDICHQADHFLCFHRFGLQTDKAGSTLHPTADMKMPSDDLPAAFWIYQSTWADLKSLEPALGKALAAGGIKRRNPPLAFEPQVLLPTDPPVAATVTTKQATAQSSQHKNQTQQPVEPQSGTASKASSKGSGGKAAQHQSRIGKQPSQQPSQQPKQVPVEEPALEEWTGIMTR